jgi:hypothetical protein
MSENGFADPTDVEAPEAPVGEGEAPKPRAAFERSPLKVLASLETRPLEQAMKAIEYIGAGRERERKIVKSLSPAALSMVAQNGPEYLSAVQASA